VVIPFILLAFCEKIIMKKMAGETDLTVIAPALA
jgi:hypothetical protein